MKKIKVSSIVTSHCNLGNAQMNTTFFHMSKKEKLCNLIIMHKCHVFLTVVENSSLFDEFVCKLGLFGRRLKRAF
jgi:hypothetical protein